MEKRLQHTTTKLAQVQSELKEEKELRSSLQINQTTWQTKYKELQEELSELKTTKESEVRDLQEQVRDFMFYFEAQKQIENSANRDEIAAGQIVIAPSPSGSKLKGSRSSKGHKRH